MKACWRMVGYLRPQVQLACRRANAVKPSLTNAPKPDARQYQFDACLSGATAQVRQSQVLR